MLKMFLGFVVSVVVLLASAYVVSPTYAASANIILTQIQAGGIGAATQEFVVIYNNSPEDVDITGWCVTNKSDVRFSCFTPPLSGQAMYLPAYKYAVIVSSSLASLLPAGTATSAYIPTNQSSGSMTGSSDTVSLVDHMGIVVDSHSWTIPIVAGMQFERHTSGSPVTYQDTDAASDWSIAPSAPLPVGETYIDTTIADVCSNLEGDQLVLPAGKEINEAGECIDKVIMQLVITEVLPNAIGSDAGQEFIELYNPNNTPVALSAYKLHVGPTHENSYDFPIGVVIQSHGYQSFSNSDIPFSLLNSSSRVLLTLQDETVISETTVYEDPIDGYSWALINDVWQYTNQPTPGLANLVLDPSLSIGASTPEPCAVNQYRSPETNRCRNIATSIVTPCKDNQYRSEETGRCRNIATDTKTITPCEANEERSIETNRCRKIVIAATAAPCKEGQERNPDTNRCRTITKMPSANYGVLGAETKNSGNWYVFAAVGGIVLLALGYAIWEWHDEVGKFMSKWLSTIRQFARLRK